MKEGADTLQISGIHGNRLQSQYAISKNTYEIELDYVTSIISLIMSYTKEYFYVLAALKKEGRRKKFEIQKFKLTQDINKPFEFVCSVEADLQECNRITATKYMEGKIEKELILVSGDKFRIFNSDAEKKTI